jgi:hypothetical protein
LGIVCYRNGVDVTGNDYSGGFAKICSRNHTIFEASHFQPTALAQGLKNRSCYDVFITRDAWNIDQIRGYRNYVGVRV